MAARKSLKSGAELNGRYQLKGTDFMLVQYYPGIDCYYAIINNDPALQTGFTLKQLRCFLKKHQADQNTI